MSRGEPIGRWYESRTSDGKLWCGSSDPEEVLEHSSTEDALEHNGGKDFEFSVIVTYQYQSREDWDGRLPDSGTRDG